MRVMVLVKATAQSEAGRMPSTELLAAMGDFNQALADAGVLVSGEGLKPSSQGTRVGFDGDRRSVVKGPFRPVTEQVAGFWIWQVRDMDEALHWAKRCPNPMRETGQLEIRPLFEIEDFGEAMTDELATREEELRRRTAGD